MGASRKVVQGHVQCCRIPVQTYNLKRSFLFIMDPSYESPTLVDSPKDLASGISTLTSSTSVMPLSITLVFAL